MTPPFMVNAIVDDCEGGAFTVGDVRALAALKPDDLLVVQEEGDDTIEGLAAEGTTSRRFTRRATRSAAAVRLQ
jgi:hypothetical protein